MHGHLYLALATHTLTNKELLWMPTVHRFAFTVAAFCGVLDVF